MENKELANIDYTKSSLEEEYYRCTFKNCNFSGMRIGKVLFEQCRFEHCNLSLVMASNTSWQEVTFYECKMTGTNLAASNGFSLSFTFEGCILSYAIFQELILRNSSCRKRSLVVQICPVLYLKSVTFPVQSFSILIWKGRILQRRYTIA